MIDINELWHVRVFTHDDGRVEHYHFRRGDDLMASIRATWSRMAGANAVSVHHGVNSVTVRRMSDSRTELIAQKLVGEILDGPTHF